MAGPRRTLIVGGGIVGLTMAAALGQRGFSTDLVEREARCTWSGPELL
jgi:2-polyprenyl-6-methoxyphenol hydroxylase-like FAD-dependent oxidoreductase